MYFTPLIFLLIVLVGCQPASTDKPPSPPVAQTAVDARPNDLTPANQANKDSTEPPSFTLIEEFSDVELKPQWMDSCWPSLYRETWVDSIIAHPRISRKTTDDGCVLLTLELLEAGIIQGTCPRCLEALNAAAAVSDGYVAEAIDDIAANLYYNAFESLIKFMAEPKYDSKEFFDRLVHGFYYKIAGNISDGKVELRRAEVINDIGQKMAASHRTQVERQLLMELEQRVRKIEVSSY